VARSITYLLPTGTFALSGFETKSHDGHKRLLTLSLTPRNTRVNNNTEPTSSMGGTRLPPDYKKIRKYLRTIHQREALGRFIKAGWTPAELAEYARQMYLVPGQTTPTAASYQFVVEKGPEHEWAKEALATTMRAPGFVMPPFDRPVPKRYAYDDPGNPEHTPEMRAEVNEVARLIRNRFASQHALPRPDPDEPIPTWLWKRSFRIRNRYHSLEDTLVFELLWGYRDELLAVE
jgi:hypothetical protein